MNDKPFSQYALDSLLEQPRETLIERLKAALLEYRYLTILGDQRSKSANTSNCSCYLPAVSTALGKYEYFKRNALAFEAYVLADKCELVNKQIFTDNKLFIIRQFNGNDNVRIDVHLEEFVCL